MGASAMKVWQPLCAVLAGIVGGCCLLVGYLQHDPYMYRLVQERLEVLLSHSLECHFTGTVTGLDICSGTIQLVEVSACAPDTTSWKWHTKKLALSASWWNILLGRQMEVSAQLEQMRVSTTSTLPSIALLPHLQKLLGGIPGIPMSFRTLHIEQGDFVLHDASGLSLQTAFQVHAHLSAAGIAIHLFTQHTQAHYHDIHLASAGQLTTQVRVPRRAYDQMQVNLSGSWNVPLLGNQSFYIRAAWHDQNATLTLTDTDRLWNIELKECGLDAQSTLNLQGQIVIPLQVITNVGLSSGQQLLTGNIRSDIRYSNQKVHGTLLYQPDATSMACPIGSWYYAPVTQKGEFVIEQLPALQKGAVTLTVDRCSGTLEQGMLKTAGLDAHLQLGSQKASYPLEIQLNQHTDHYMLRSQCADYVLTATCTPKNGAGSFALMHRQQQEMEGTFNLVGKHITGQTDFALVQRCIEQLYGYHMVGQARVCWSANWKKSVLEAQARLSQAHIRIPHTYNLLQAAHAQATFDISSRLLRLKDFSCFLDQGALECPQATFFLTPAYDVQYAYMPICVSNMLCALDKDMLLVLSGQLHVHKELQTPWQLGGMLVLDRGYLKKNIFSFSEYKRSLQPRLGSTPVSGHIDLVLQNKEPLHIQTLFLETSAGMQLHLQGQIPHVQISGAIHLLEGKILFPYKPLIIQKGALYFTPEQGTDPSLELVAQAKIRGYGITVRCSGSVKKPIVQFESSPLLTEEQILTLLLAGSAEGSLQAVMPALIMQSAQNLLFGSQQEMSKVQQYFQKILKSLRYIRFVPKFFDQTARGGFRGAIEVDVHDQLRGIVQRNFSLPEDMRYEVEYNVSDDMAVRGIRDERGDFGGEVELKWRF